MGDMCKAYLLFYCTLPTIKCEIKEMVNKYKSTHYKMLPLAMINTNSIWKK